MLKVNIPNYKPAVQSNSNINPDLACKWSFSEKENIPQTDYRQSGKLAFQPWEYILFKRKKNLH